MPQPLSSHRHIGAANIFIDKKGNKKRPIPSMLKKSLTAADGNSNAAVEVGDACGGAQGTKDTTPESIADSLFEGGSLPHSSLKGTPSTRAVFKEADKLAGQERRQRSRQQERKRQWQQWKESGRTADDEQLQTHTQLSRAEENKRRRLGDDLQRRAPTAPMAATVSRTAASTNSPGLFVGQSRSESLESGEIAETNTTIGKTNGRTSLLERIVMPCSSPEPDVPRRLKGKQTAPTGKAAADSEPQEWPRWPIRPFPGSSSSEESDRDSSEESDRDSSDEPVSGVPARKSDSSIPGYQPMFAKRPPTDSVNRQPRDSILATAEARPKGQEQAIEQTTQSESVSQDAKPDMAQEGAETQRYQEIVNTISAEQEAADPDVDPAVAGDLGEGPGIALSRSRRTLSGSGHETKDVVMHEADHASPETPATGTVVPAIQSSCPRLLVRMQYKKNGGARPRDCGWKFQHLKEEGKRQRMALIKDMERHWGRPVESVVPRVLWPRPFEAAAGVEPFKEPRSWSQELLKALREVSKITAGHPGLARRKLREAVTLQVAQHGGPPFLCKDDVQFAETLLHGFRKDIVRSGGPDNISAHGNISMGSSRPPMQDRTGDVGHTPESDRHPPSVPGSRGSVAIRITSTPPQEEHDVPSESAAERVSNLLGGPLEVKAELESDILETVLQEAVQPEAVRQNDRDLRSTLPDSPQRATPQTASTSQPPEKLPLTKQQKLLIEEYKLARLRRDLLANDIDPDSI